MWYEHNTKSKVNNHVGSLFCNALTQLSFMNAQFLKIFIKHKLACAALSLNKSHDSDE